MALFGLLGGLTLRQIATRRVLARRLEPEPLTDAAANVAEYDQVMGTKLALAYALALRTIFRAWSPPAAGAILDLASGPGHFSLCLGRFFSNCRATGFDLAPRMVACANRNARLQGLADRVAFELADITNLANVDSASADLTTFTDAAHHMPDIGVVRQVLEEMERVTRPEGLIFAMDLVRLKTERLTNRYVDLMGHDYVERGLPHFLEDFRNSMFAAFTPEELRQAVPPESKRTWRHWVPFGLPTTQLLIGLPVGRTRLFLRRGNPWTRETHPVPKSMRLEWRLLQLSMALGQKTQIPPRRGGLR